MAASPRRTSTASLTWWRKIEPITAARSVSVECVTATAASGPKVHATRRVWVYKHGRSREREPCYWEAMSTELPRAATQPVT